MATAEILGIQIRESEILKSHEATLTEEGVVLCGNIEAFLKALELEVAS